MAKVDNDEAVVSPIADIGGNISFLSNINPISTNINNNNRNIVENRIKELLYAQY